MRPIKLKPDNDVSLNVKRSPFIYSPIQSNTARQKTPGSVLGKFLERKANSQKASCDLQYVVSDAKLFPLQISSGPWEMCVKFLWLCTIQCHLNSRFPMWWVADKINRMLVQFRTKISFVCVFVKLKTCGWHDSICVLSELAHRRSRLRVLLNLPVFAGRVRPIPSQSDGHSKKYWKTRCTRFVQKGHTSPNLDSADARWQKLTIWTT